MNAAIQFRLPQNPVLRVLAVLALASIAIALFVIGAMIWLTLLVVGLVSMLVMRLFGTRPPSARGAGQGDIIEGEYRIVDEGRKPSEHG